MADRRRLAANLAAAGLLLATGTGVLLWQKPWASEHRHVVAAPIPADARALLARQFRELSTASSRAEFVAAAGRSTASRRFATSAWSARRELDVKSARFVYERGGEVADRADGSTSARVTVSPGGVEVRFRLVPRADGFDVVSASGIGRDRLPVWLAGPLRVVRGSGTTLLLIDGGIPHTDDAALVRTASRAVRRMVPDAGRRLLVVSPGSDDITASILGRRPAAIAQLAAVSTSLGGPGGDPAVVVNPALFSAMAPPEQRLVMTHEATHVLTGAVGHPMTLWVAEGFADFVALHGVAHQLDHAGQILQQVKKSGAPKALPSAKEFDESAHGLGAVYESAWMAFRMLGAEYGDVAVRGFYDDVLQGSPVESAALRRFGLTVGGITTQWRAYLTKSASMVS